MKYNKCFWNCLTLALTLATTTSAWGGNFQMASDLGSTIINDNSSLAATSTITIEASDLPVDNGDITDVFFTIEGLAHQWLGDLTVRVKHNQAGQAERVATLMERIGIEDAGNPGPGDSSNFDSTYLFQDGQASTIWESATAIGDNDSVLGFRTADGLVRHSPRGSENQAVGLNFKFVPTSGDKSLNSVLGDWTFEFQDLATASGAVGDSAGGSFTRTRVNFLTATAVPEPGSMVGLLGCVVVGLLRRRR